MSEKQNNRPPKLALRLFSWFCKPAYHLDIEGDLIEHFEENLKEKGLKRARLLFLLDVLLLFRPGIIRPLFNKQTLKHPTMYKHNFKISWRHLVKNKGYSFLNISGLAVGMAVVILISLYLWDELSYNKYHKNYDRIAQVMQNQNFEEGILTWFTQAKQLAPELRDNYGSNFKYVSMSSGITENSLTYGDKTIKTDGHFMEAIAPDMLSLKMLTGSRTSLEDPYSILLSKSTALAIFGEEDPMNKTLKLNIDNLVKVTGVYEDLPSNSSFSEAHFMGSWDLYEKWMPEWVNWGNSWFQTYVQLADNVNIDQASLLIKDAKLNNISEAGGSKYHPQLFLHPMSKWHLYSEFENGVVSGGRIENVWLFGTIGIFILLLACINFMNLSTARSEKRAQEIGIRKSLGSYRLQLINQFFSESILVAGLAFVFSIVLVLLLMPFFNEVSGKELSNWWANPVFWSLGISSTIVIGLLAGIYPALFLSSFRPIQVLNGSVRVGKNASLPRKIMVTLQFVVSIVLITGTMIVYQQIQFGKNRPVGYDQSRLLASSIASDDINKRYDAFRNDLLQTGDIEEVAKSGSFVSYTFITNSGFEWEGKDPEMQDEFVTLRITHEFGKTIGWNIIEGRDFSREFATDSVGLVINEAAVEYLGFEDPIGKRIKWGNNGYYHIIGVVKNIIGQSPYSPTRQMIFCLDYNRTNVANIKLKAEANIAAALPKIEAVFKKYDPVTPFTYRFIDEDYARKFSSAERIGKLAGFFTILAILISCLGLFGMIAFVAERRTKEIGIRKVLGASVLSLWQMLTKEFVVLVVIASIIAIPLAYYYMSNWLNNYEYHINISAWVFVLALVLAVIITLATVSFQAISAAMASPMKSLRSE
ncbi:MAG: ABC transporter permease [Bacteroidota bacterium]